MFIDLELADWGGSSVSGSMRIWLRLWGGMRGRRRTVERNSGDEGDGNDQQEETTVFEALS